MSFLLRLNMCMVGVLSKYPIARVVCVCVSDVVNSQLPFIKGMQSPCMCHSGKPPEHSSKSHENALWPRFLNSVHTACDSSQAIKTFIYLFPPSKNRRVYIGTRQAFGTLVKFHEWVCGSESTECCSRLRRWSEPLPCRWFQWWFRQGFPYSQPSARLHLWLFQQWPAFFQ